MLRKIMIIVVSGVGLATGHVADASAHFDRGRSFQNLYGYWDPHNCTVPYYYNSFGSWNGFSCYPRR